MPAGNPRATKNPDVAAALMTAWSARSRAADSASNRAEMSMRGMERFMVGSGSIISNASHPIMIFLYKAEFMGPYVDSVTSDEAIPAATRVVIIGGGIIGTSAAL